MIALSSAKFGFEIVADLIDSGILAINDGYRVRNLELGASGIPFVRGGDIRDGSINAEVSDRIRPEFSVRVKGKLTQPGDVAFISKGTVGRVGRVRNEQPSFVFAPQVCFWRSLDHERLDPTYLFFVIRSSCFQAQLDGVKTHGSMVADYVSLADQRRFRLPFPSIASQRFIANTLGTLDDKIELNRQTNETLEAIARALFKSWFVDFDPVQEKAAGRKPAGLDTETARLFPSEFEDSPLGKIPKGWTIARLSDHTEAAKGLSYKGSGLSDAGLPMHNLNSVFEGGGYKHEGIKFYTGEYRDRHLVSAGEVIVANTEQGHDCLLLGYAAIVPERLGQQGLFSHHIYRLRILDGSPVTPDFLCRLLNSQRMHELISGFGNGTTVNMLPIDGVQQPEFVLPPKGLISAFTELAESIRRRRDSTLDENNYLATTRDALLPKLLSGELSGDANCHLP